MKVAATAAPLEIGSRLRAGVFIALPPSTSVIPLSEWHPPKNRSQPSWLLSILSTMLWTKLRFHIYAGLR
ncbi:MAG: hypothetical protein WBV06_02645, partial [Acidimicrobiia bacterium]